MKRLILEIGYRTDVYGQDYTKAALGALDDALRHSSIAMFSVLDLSHADMRINVTINVWDPRKVDVEQIKAAVRWGRANLNVIFGGQNIDAHGIAQPSVIATCAVEAFVPNMSENFKIG